MPPSRIHWANGCRHPVDLQCRWSMLECERHDVYLLPSRFNHSSTQWFPRLFLGSKAIHSLQNTRSQGCKPMLRCRWQRGTVHQHHWLICHHLTPQNKASKGLPEKTPDKVSTIHGTSPHYSHYCLLLHMMCR